MQCLHVVSAILQFLHFVYCTIFTGWITSCLCMYAWEFLNLLLLLFTGTEFSDFATFVFSVP